jgi:hypothetical protein
MHLLQAKHEHLKQHIKELKKFNKQENRRLDGLKKEIHEVDLA